MLKMALFDCGITMKNVAALTEDGAFALFVLPHPGGFDSSGVPTPGNLPSKAKKLLMPGGEPGGVLGAGRIDWCITKVCRGSGAKVVQKNIQVICRIITSGTLILSRRIGSHVEFDFRALRNWARAGMVEWNGIFRLFRFSGILGQPREVHPKFRNEIPEMSVPFAPKPGISEIFGRMESARELLAKTANKYEKTAAEFAEFKENFQHCKVPKGSHT